jgi:hypothetical protein
MHIFSNPKKKKEELILVFNVGSSSVGGALFWTQSSGSSGIPKIIFSVNESIPILEKVDLDQFLSLTIKTLQTVAQKIYEARLGAPAKIFCVLSSPWHISQTRIISLKKNTPFVFNAKLADELIQKEIKIFKEQHLKQYGSSIRAFELKNIKTILNGYETSRPLGQKAKELEIAIFVSISGEQVLKKIEEAIMKYFHFEQIKFSSFTMALFTTTRDLKTPKENFLLIDINGELTDIFIIKKGIPRESISFPLGQNFLTREVASLLHTSLNEANSLVSLFKDGQAEEKFNKKLLPLMSKLKKEWLKNFQNSLANMTHDISIPATIYLVINENLADFFTEIIKTEQFNQYTLTESKFEVVFLDTKILNGLAVFAESVIREPSLIIDAVYINRFLIYPFKTGRI